MEECKSPEAEALVAAAVRGPNQAASAAARVEAHAAVAAVQAGVVKSKICLRISKADVGEDCREKSFFSGILESSKKNPPNWVHRRPFRQNLAGIFGNFKLLAFHCHRSNSRARASDRQLFTREKFLHIVLLTLALARESPICILHEGIHTP